VIWALYGALLRKWRVNGLRGAAISGALSLAYAPLHLALFGAGAMLAAPGMALMQAFWQGLFIGGLGFVLYSYALSVLGPARGAMFPPLDSVLGVILAALVLSETVTGLQVAGLITVLAGMLCGALIRR
jgi:drug/metabolite transporter (DMT)-like permease